MSKKSERAYDIDVYGLRLGVHNFEFEFSDELFEVEEAEEEQIVEKGQGLCKVTLEKSELLITLLFEIKGEVELVCDRSLEEFMFPLAINERLILKYGDELDDSGDDVWIVPYGIQTFNVKRNILEFINVAIPMKRLHPKFGEDDAEGMELIYSSEDDESESQEEDIDPRWAALQQLKNLKN
ncbi:DUF177 domain-containing protein [Reichenbachiella sp. MALMAid0571]|uniref:YceD family protein n=1 Tax=Reichenbachiella sp. MALMAid0571 TaxID=3143939 RepID=UPI0032DF1F61